MIRKRSLFSLCMVLILGICTLSFGGCGNSQTADDQSVSATSANDDMTSAEESADAGTEDADMLTGMHHVSMELEGYGTVTIELNADKAPITVTNFVKLVNEGFYDGLTFHRIFPDQFVQGGDPNGNGTGNSDQTIKGEFTANGSDNDLSHTEGAIAMARTSEPDSASCQFFIDLMDMSSQWDGQYAVFGYVTEGLDLVKQMSEDAAQYITDQNGTVDTAHQPVITKMTVID